MNLARGVRATAWYIAASILVFLAMALFLWGVVVLVDGIDTGSWWRIVVFGAGAALTLTAVGGQLVRYHRDGRLDEDERPRLARQVLAWPMAALAAGALLLGAAGASVILASALIAVAACMLRWPAGVRLRIVATVSALLIALWVVHPDVVGGGGLAQTAVWSVAFTVSLPAMTVLSLWSWDVVTELDRARATESRLAATQERLRLAAELHDLQGHHLQVIALQLELAERMLARDPAAAADQIRLARASVDGAREGTRELAGRFRGVPLPDELANAADLLRAAGLTVRLDLAREAAAAPAELLGPVVRECTTNVLKHGGGVWAELHLGNDGGSWRLRVANDAGDASRVGAGAGLEGIAHRVGVAGGEVRHRRVGERFEVVVTVPVSPVGVDAAADRGRTR